MLRSDEKRFPGVLTFKIKIVLLSCAYLLGGLVCRVTAQSLGPFDRDNVRVMLSEMKDDLKKHYYDPTFHGMDLDARFKQAEEQIKQAKTRDQLMIIVAQVLMDLNDSHTAFLPPTRAAEIEYGWRMQLVGDNCYIIAVKPKSDAEAKGLKVGDAILSVDGYRPTRDNLWKMNYRYFALMPASSVRLVVQSPGDAQPRQLDIASKIERKPGIVQWEKEFFIGLGKGWYDWHKDKKVEFGDELMIWRMSTFSVSEDFVDNAMGKARKFKTLIIDLRDNGGGSVKALERLVGYFFDKDLKISDEKGRKETKPSTAKTRGSDVFKGQLIVLVDSETGSASEHFARIIQLEKRGTVIGDRTAGAVMTARYYPHQTNTDDVGALYYGSIITIGDSIMPDGKSLEKVGVMPDQVMLPTGADLAAQRDPVLSHAAKLAGVELDPEKAGTFFPFDWKRQ